MPKVDFRRYTPQQRDHYHSVFTDMLKQFALSLEGQAFLDDLLMESEIIMFARRIEIARRLLLGWSFDRIERTLHVGLQNVRCVDRWLNGKLHNYRATLRPRKGPIVGEEFPAPHSTVAWIQKTYPEHIAFINALFNTV